MISRRHAASGLLRRNARGDGGGAAAAAPASAPLDGLSAATRAAIAHARWSGGKLFSDYAGRWSVGCRSDDPGAAATADLRGIADALALRNGDAVSILEHRIVDQSGNGHDLLPTHNNYRGVLVQSDGTPHLSADGTLAMVIPDNATAGGAYSAAGRMGLAADTSAYELWFNGAGTASAAFLCWGFWDGDDGYYAGFLDWYPRDNFTRFDAWPVPSRVSYVEWYSGISDGYIRLSKPAGASTSDIVVECNGVAVGDRIVTNEGVPSLAADADRTTYMLFATSQGPCAANIAIGPVAGSPGGVVPPADAAILRTFFASLGP